MAWTRIIGPKDAQGELKELYSELRARRVDGLVEFMGVYTQEPHILRWLVQGPGPHYGVTAIDERLVEMIIVAVSAANKCHNCVAIHARRLRALTGDEALTNQVSKDYTRAPLNPQTRAALDYAVKLTIQPTTMTLSDVEALRQTGYSDQQIVDIAHVAAWFNYVNRIAEGLGTQLRQREG